MKCPSRQGPVQDDNMWNNDQIELYLQLASLKVDGGQELYQQPTIIGIVY